MLRIFDPVAHDWISWLFSFLDDINRYQALFQRLVERIIMVCFCVFPEAKSTQFTEDDEVSVDSLIASEG